MSKARQRRRVSAFGESHVRNVCVLGHIDHGKSSIVDWLVAEMGVIPPRLAGQLRYLDDLPAEQERGITMRASAVSIVYEQPSNHEEFLVTVVDSPGHIDFAYDAGAAARASDGCVLVVDVMEGARAQSLAALRSARLERLAPVLVLNKIDRLCDPHTGLESSEAFERLRQIVEGLNAQYNVFDAEKNIVFASAKHGWAFTVHSAARLLAPRLGFNRKQLAAMLFEADVALATAAPASSAAQKETKMKKEFRIVKRHGKHSARPPLFASHVLAPLFASVRTEEEDGSSSNYQNDDDNFRFVESSTRLADACPLARVLLRSIIDTVPSPLQASAPPKRFFIADERGALRSEQLAVAVVKFFFAASKDQRVDSEHIMALARIVKGELCPGQELYCRTTHKIDDDDLILSGPLEKMSDSTKVIVRQLWAPMGADAIEIESAGPGRIVVLGPEIAGCAAGAKRCSLSLYGRMSPRDPAALQPPLLVVAVQAKDRSRAQELDAGLRALAQLDSAAELSFAANGDRLLAAVGDLHLDQCLRDLTERYLPNDLEIEVSPPVVGFREGLTGEVSAIEDAPQLTWPPWRELVAHEDLSLSLSDAGHAKARIVRDHNNDDEVPQQCVLTVSAQPIDMSVAKLLLRDEEPQDNDDDDDDDDEEDDEEGKIDTFSSSTSKQLALRVFGNENIVLLAPRGPRGARGVLLGAPKALIDTASQGSLAAVRAGFALAAANGPLAEEPMHAVAFLLEELSVGDAQHGVLISATRRCCRAAVLASPIRVLEPIFICELRCGDQKHLKAMYALVRKRRGRVVAEDMCLVTNDFLATVKVPASQAIGFPAALLDWTSGAATAPSVQFFDDYLTLGNDEAEIDPFWKPTTLDEREEFGDAGSARTAGTDADVTANAPRRLINHVRKRKGLPVEIRLSAAAAEARSSNARIRN